MRLLFLDAYFEPEQIAFTHLEKDLLEGLIQAGHEVEIVCPTPTRGVSKEEIARYRRIKREVLYDGHVHVTRFLAPQESKRTLMRVIRYLWCNLRTYQIGKRIKDVDVVFANSTPPTQGWIAGKVAKKHGIPFIYSLQDIFPDSLVNAGMTKKDSLIWRIGRRIEEKTNNDASKIITISEGFKENLLLKQVSSSKIIVIPNWINTDKVYPIDKKDNKLFDLFSLDRNKFYVCYSGNIGHTQNLELLIDVAKRIQELESKIEFVIIGDGAAKGFLIEKIEESEVNNVHLFPFQPYENIASVFSLGDVGLIISKAGIGNSSVPSKTWSIMAAARPVIASFDLAGPLYNVINDVKCGRIVPAGNAEQLVQVIIEAYNNRELIALNAKNGYKYVNEYANKEKCVSEYIAVLSNN